MCYRRIQLVELNGDRLVEKQSTFVSLTDAECNVATIATKVSETLNCGEEYVLLDSRNQELMDCPVTQGLHLCDKLHANLVAAAHYLKLPCYGVSLHCLYKLVFHPEVFIIYRSN